jgi:hypothetical protein
MLFTMAKKENGATASADDRTSARHDTPNPVWFKPIMFGFMLIGLLWIITFYVSAAAFPIPGIGASNILIGFGLMFVGFLMTTRWR